MAFVASSHPQQACTCTREEIKAAYPELKISDNCPECESVGIQVRISFHRSQSTASTTAGAWVRDLTREGVEANPGPCNGGTDAIDGKCPQNCAVFVPNEEKKNSCDYCMHHKACHTDVAGTVNDDTKKRSFSVLEQEDLVNAKFAKLEEMQAENKRQQDVIIKSLEANKTYYPSMSPTQEGVKIMTERQHVRIPPEYSDLPSVLTTAEQSRIDSINNEYLLVAHITLKLAPILNTHHRCLVNSENYPWLRFLDITTFVTPTTTTASTAVTTTSITTASGTASASSSPAAPPAAAPLSAFPDPTPHDEKPDLWLGPSFILHPMGNPLTMPGAKSIGGVATNEYRCSRSNEEKNLYKQGIPDPKHYYWFDCLSPLAAKLEMTNESIGELKNYLSKLSDPRDMAGLGKSIYAEKCRGMLITRKQFLLLECHGNVVTQSCIGEWTQPGSIKFIQEFFHPSNAWLLAMEHVTNALNAQDIFIIDIIKPLGRGANGRVVECKYRYKNDTNNNARTSALKVVVGKNYSAMSQLYTEYIETNTRITREKELASSSITIATTSSSTSDDNTYYSPLACLLPSGVHHFYCSGFDKSTGYYYGCYMLDPIGIPIDYNKLYTSSSLFIGLMQSLQSLHRNGITHGDARLPNIIKRPSIIDCHCCSKHCGYIWIDFRDSMISDYYCDKLPYYRNDLERFLSSMRFPTNNSFISTFISNYDPSTYNYHMWYQFYTTCQHHLKPASGPIPPILAALNKMTQQSTNPTSSS